MKSRIAVLSLFLFFQAIIPLKSLMGGEDPAWTRIYTRFSWRDGIHTYLTHGGFKITDATTGEMLEFYSRDPHLNTMQMDHIIRNPDLVVEYLIWKSSQLKKQNLNQRQKVTPEIYSGINSGRQQVFITMNPNMDDYKDSKNFNLDKIISKRYSQ
ncbi:MAG: HTTM domain-containing protein [Candidatus Omnitrophica bacterium]|nr:HTTM domain-containing protein [Candidatus Omnitrophota bacterium]